MIIDKNFNVVVSLENEKENNKLLKHMAEKCLKGQMSGGIIKIYKERLNNEFCLIQKSGQAKTFLILKELFEWARSNQIILRAYPMFYGSLVASLFKISDADPLFSNIPAERYIKPGSAGISCAKWDISLILSHLKDLYGSENIGYLSSLEIAIGKISKNRDAIDCSLESGTNCRNRIDLKTIKENNLTLICLEPSKALEKLQCIEAAIRESGAKDFEYHYFDKAMVELLKKRDFDDIYKLDETFKNLLEKTKYLVDARVLSDLIALAELVKGGITNIAEEYIHAINNKAAPPMIYQESFINELASYGYSNDEADIIRLDLAIKNKEKLDKHKQEFFNKLMQHGVGEKAIENLWTAYTNKVPYLRRKAYVKSIIRIVFKEIYYKAHFPQEFNRGVYGFITSNRKRDDL